MRLARLGTLSVLMPLLLAPGCGSDEAPFLDAGPRTEIEAGMATDTGVAIDAAPAPPDPNENPARLGTCYDGVDNDGDDELDCADSECATGPVCCVGSVTCCTDRPMVTLTIPSGCVDATFADCALDPEFSAFGETLPTFEGGGLIPQGGTTYGGVTLGPAIDPRAANVTIAASVDIPSTRCTDCIDAAGIGFFESVPGGAERGVVRLGVLVSGSRNEVQIIVADRPVAHGTLTADSATLEIRLKADGTAQILGLAGTDPYELEAIDLPESLSPVVFGRTDNRSDGEAAISVRNATVTVSDCDMPSAVVRRANTVLPARASSWTPTALGRISIVDFGGDVGGVYRPNVHAVFEDDGVLLKAQLNGNRDLIGESGPPDNALAATDANASLHDPWLMRDGGRAVLYFAEQDAGGQRSIRRASATITDLDFNATAQVTLPSEVLSADGPTVWLGGPLWHMIARVDTGSGPELVALVSSDGMSFNWANDGLEGAVVRRISPEDPFAFQRDEVASPALVQVDDGTLRLYYGARRGGRWSIGLLVSREGVSWRDMGPVLEGDGEGFDALGALHPAPVPTQDGQVHLYYVGTDGATSAVGLAGRAGTLGE